MLYCSIHLLIFVPFGTNVSKCVLVGHLFGEDYHTAARLLIIPLFVPPYLCTNTIYVYLLIFTKRKFRTIGVSHVKPNQSDKIKLEPKKDNNTLIVEINSVCNRTLRTQSAPQDSEEPSSSKRITKTKCGATNDQEPSTSAAYESHNIGINDQTVQEIKRDKLPKRRAESNPAITSNKNTHLGLILQRRALVTFGILLASLNVFMTPIISVSILDLLWHGTISHDAYLIFASMAMLNSALNPVITFGGMVMMEKARRLRFW